MFVTVAAVLVGVALLAFAADQFVLGAARVALLRQLPPLLVGVVIIGFGTSSPELLVSAIAAFGDRPEVAIGNIVGSNLVNLSLLLGVGAIIAPIAVSSATVRREAPAAVAATIAFAVVVQGGIGPWEGGLLLLALALVLWTIARPGSGSDPLADDAEELADSGNHDLRVEVGRTVLGLVGTVAGANLLLWGALDLADRAGLAEGFVGATLVAIGTSLPELVTVVQSARRRESDLIVGNLLGSNLFNALGVGGVIGLIGISEVDDRALTTVATSAAVVVAAIALLAMMTGRTVRRWEGVALVVVYLALVPLLA
ncbi:MAG: calcium/sodium antiporter [Acidimicrobiales bacterium]